MFLSGYLNGGTLKRLRGLDGDEIARDLPCLLSTQENGRVSPTVDEVAHMKAVLDSPVQRHDPVLAENEEFLNSMSRYL